MCNFWSGLDTTANIVPLARVIDHHTMNRLKMSSHRTTRSSSTLTMRSSSTPTSLLAHTLTLTQMIENLKLAIQAQQADFNHSNTFKSNLMKTWNV